MNKLLLVISLLIFITVPTVAWSQDCTADDGTDGVELWGECYSIENTTELSLSNSGLTGEIPSEIGNLTNLTYLNLSENQLTGEIPESICNLVNLQELSLQNNQLCPPYPECLTDDQIGEQLCAGPCSGCNPVATMFYEDECTQWVTDIDECNGGDLQVLEELISQNGIDEETSMTDYDNGDGIFEPLEMGEQYWVNGRLTRFNPFGNWNNDPVEFFYGFTVIPENIGNLSELTYLDLDNNQLETLPGSFGDLNLLDTLWFGRNPLEVIPESIFDLISLNFLGIYNTNISEIPPEIGNLTNLTELYLSSNQLTGEIPPEIGNLTNLTELYLSNNQLTGSISPEIGDLTNLTYLNLSNNQLTGSIPPEIGNLTNLINLDLSDNDLTGEIPSEIGNLTNLINLYLSDNQFTGPIPPEIGDLTNLTELNLGGHYFTGSIPSEIGNLTNLINLDLSDNDLTGEIPSEIGNLIHLEDISLWWNNLNGDIPPEIGNLVHLEKIMLWDNNLNGEIPPEIGNLTNLTNLVLNGNNLTGEIPSEIWGLTNLTELLLKHNQLTGSIPYAIGNLVNLIWLDLGGNEFTGSIPSEVGNLTNLAHLDLWENNLDGEIPESICNLVEIFCDIQLESNNLCPPYPDCLSENDILPQETSECEEEFICDEGYIELWGFCYNIEETTNLDLSEIGITGEIPSEIGSLINLERIFLNENQLSGEIPSEIGSLTNLERMYLHENQLSGEIPSEIGSLTNLDRMHLNDNVLSGFIPETLCDLDINFGSSPRFRIYNNNLCPPYPECIEDYVGEQDTSNCGEGGVTVDYNSEWNLVGLPLAVDDSYYLTIFPDAVENTLFSFDVTYNLDSMFVNGDGYWLRFDEAGTTTITGQPLNELTITLSQDWNLISGLSETFSVYSITDPDGIIVENTLFGFDITYVLSQELAAGEGYWIRAYEAGDITLTSGAMARVTPQEFSLNDKANTLTINGMDLYFGVQISGKERLSYSLPPKPPAGAFDVRFKDGWRAVKDYSVVEVMSTTETLTIAYDIVLNAGEHYNWVLTATNGEDYILEGSGEITVPSAERFILELKAVVPSTFTLHPNHPNPFNPITTLSYDLPKDSDVRLAIFDMLGNEVATLVNSNQKAGFKSVQWDGTDSMGRPVSAGVYLYQIQAGEFVQTKKMVLLK